MKAMDEQQESVKNEKKSTEKGNKQTKY